MQRLTVNPATLAMALATLTGTHEEINYFASQLMRSCATELSLYQSTPPADATPEAVQAAAVGKSEWGDIVHPHVVGQVLVDLCERASQPCPDNLFVYVGTDWVPLHNVQPSAPAKPATPPAPQTPAITPQQIASPATVEQLQRVEVMGATILKVASPAPAPSPGAPVPAGVLETTPVTLQGLIDQVAPPVPDMVEDAHFTEAATSAPAPAPVPTPGPATATRATLPAGPVVVGEFGIPPPDMAAPKGKSPFESDPGGKVPTSAPDRAMRDWVAMSTQLFNTPPAVLIKGDGKGVVQRQRVYMALLLLVDQILSSVPDDTTPVGYLRFHLSHLRYNASQTAAGPTMIAWEQYLFRKDDSA